MSRFHLQFDECCDIEKAELEVMAMKEIEAEIMREWFSNIAEIYVFVDENNQRLFEEDFENMETETIIALAEKYKDIYRMDMSDTEDWGNE